MLLPKCRSGALAVVSGVSWLSVHDLCARKARPPKAEKSEDRVTNALNSMSTVVKEGIVSRGDCLLW